MDIVVIDFPYISVLLGNGDGTFQAPIDISNDLVLGAHQLTAGDFNNDGKPDVALVGYFGGTQNFWILLGNGDGTLQAPVEYPTDVVPGSVAAADFNRDGNLDLAVGGYLGSGVEVFLGNGDGTFEMPGVEYGLGEGPVLIRDFNQDGSLDIVAGDSMLLGNGDGTFRQVGLDRAVKGTVSGVSDGLEVAGDFNGDGLPDVAFLDFANGAQDVLTMLNVYPLLFSGNMPLTFPAQLIGTTSAPNPVILTNEGTVPIEISSVSSSGAPFRMRTTCEGTIAPHANCTISPIFSPKVRGVSSGTILMSDSASSKPLVVELTGAGTVVKFSPPEVIFPPQKVGTISPSQSIQVTNIGIRPLAFTGQIIINGLGFVDFYQTNNCSKRLATGESCSISVVFAPTRKGSFNDSVFVSDTGGGSPQTAGLSGKGD
jgi:hypothetical protein